MNITSLGNNNIQLQLTDANSSNPIDMAMLKKSLDSVETTGAMLTKMMEQSVNPNLGANIDIRL